MIRFKTCLLLVECSSFCSAERSAALEELSDKADRNHSESLNEAGQQLHRHIQLLQHMLLTYAQSAQVCATLLCERYHHTAPRAPSYVTSSVQ